MKPLVSIVVPTKNSEKFLEKCLISVKNQNYPRIELIVVDNFSNDKTVEIAKKYTNNFYRKGPERSTQVNFGVLKSKGKYVYRVDSDFVLDKDVVKECVEKCENGYDAIAVHNTSDPTVSFWSRVRKLERDCYIDDDTYIAARFFRKKVFEEVGGFDEDLIAGEDYDLHNRVIGEDFKIGKINSQEVHIGEPKTLWEIIRKHYFYGKTIGKFVSKNSGRNITQIKNPFRLSYFKHRGQFLTNPILTFGFLIYQSSRFSAAGFGYLISKVEK